MASSAFSFIVSIPSKEPVRHDLAGDKITLGRGPDNGIQVLVAEVSVKHGEFVADGDGYKIADNGSTNGTTLNGAAVAASGSALSPMDKIMLGATVPAYFVPSAVLDSTSMEELITNIEASPKSAPGTGTAPIAVAVAASPGGPPAKKAVALPGKPAAPAAGASTVKLDQVKPGGGPARPPVKSPGAPGAPAAPVKKVPGGPPAPVKKAPTPGGGPAAPKPVSPTPLKRPGAPAAPKSPPSPAKKAPGVPLPKSPPKPGS